MRDFLRRWPFVSAAWLVALVGCATGSAKSTSGGDDGGVAGGRDAGDDGGVDAGHFGPCGVDCSQMKTPQCTVSVCNTGQALGALNTCVAVPSADGIACDDGQFCTTSDVCMSGTCVGGAQNDCGMVPAPCTSVVCTESTKSCAVTTVGDGTACTPTDLCQSNGVCQTGACTGTPKDCAFSPLSECNTVTCDPGTGECKGTPDSTLDGTACVLTGDLCNVDKACMSGQCVGGTPVDCSALDVACQVGVCDGTTGLCGSAPAPAGAACAQGIQACQVGACDGKGGCTASVAPSGSACNDRDACTSADTCSAGVCGGTPVTGCQLYLHETFETCPDGWTLEGDWQCGAPMNVGPVMAHGGKNCIATQIGGLYSDNDTYAGCVANSPVVDLSNATTPMLSFWAWVDTEGGTFDGWNLKASTDGQNFTEVTSVSPAYPLAIAGQAAWGGDLSAQGWQNYTADLTGYQGKPSVTLQFSFRSDAATVYPGVYIDDVTVAEPLQIPLYVTTPSPLPNAYVEENYAVQLAKIGGTSGSVWSLATGSGTNAGWLTISQTGVLTGKPAASNVGPVTVTVHVDEPTLPSNFAEQTYTFEVLPNVYYTSFEGTCPDGWTLTGDWQCGVPVNTAGPASAFAGTQCIGTGMAVDYNNDDAWAATTATSPPITLPGVQKHTLAFGMWVDTEGFTYDGANLQISTDGGTTFTVLSAVTPAYPLAIGGEPAWGGHQAGLGWQHVQADLTPYTGMTVLFRFGFHSDVSNTYAGVFIDDFLVE